MAAKTKAVAVAQLQQPTTPHLRCSKWFLFLTLVGRDSALSSGWCYWWRPRRGYTYLTLRVNDGVCITVDAFDNGTPGNFHPSMMLRMARAPVAVLVVQTT